MTAGGDGRALRAAFDRGRPGFPPGTMFTADATFGELVRNCARLSPLEDFIRQNARDPGFAGQSDIESAAWSSYKDHGYGDFFYALTRVLQPRRCVELGVLQGFSLLNVAAGLRDNGGGRIEGFDLFEEYPYRHETYANVVARIDAAQLGPYASVHQRDARNVNEQVDAVDYLHVDLSNDGETFRWVFDRWAHKVRQAIVLEGGSAARDQVGWMLTYARAPIAPAVAGIRAERPEWLITVLEPFPSMTVAIRRSECS
jgi:hypothetical protein